MFLVKKITQCIIKHQLILPEQKIVAGFSGGPDSVFLVHALLELKKIMPFSMQLAHLNHHWRESSTKEAQFCSEFAHEHKIPITQGSAHTFSSTLKFNGSKEEFARKLRKAFFKQIMVETQSDTLALGHHADDQLETFFIRLVRGATLSGLKGMLPYENHIIRPLLGLTKQEILEFLHEHALEYCVDETNTSDLFLRNRIRNVLIPAADGIDNRFKTNSLRTIHTLAQAEDYLISHTQDIFNTLCNITVHTRWLHIKKFLMIKPFMQSRIIIHWMCAEKVPFVPSEKLILEIIRFFTNKKSTTHTFNTWSMYKQKDQVTIVHKN